MLQTEVPDLLATDAVLTDGSRTSLARPAEAVGAKILMMTGSPYRIVEFDGAGNRTYQNRFRSTPSCNGSGRSSGQAEWRQCSIDGRTPGVPNGPLPSRRRWSAIAGSKPRQGRHRRAALCDPRGSQGKHPWFCRSSDPCRSPKG
jgi:hypothetical protein